MKRYVLLFFLLLASSLVTDCAGKAATEVALKSDQPAELPRFDVDDLGLGTEINASGLLLMELPAGLNELSSSDNSNDSVLVVVVHGYESRGYEWVSGIKGLVATFGSVYFYRYDWEACPDVVANDLAQRIRMEQKRGHYQRVLIFGHSYGGVVLAFAAAQLGKTPAELHIIAAPLSGFPRLLENCGNLNYDKGDKLIFPLWEKQVRVIQHKTVHAQDGAFRDLASDPQDIDLPFFRIDMLPPTMDGHRLGHNWSVTWVLDRYLGRPHRN